MVKVKDCCCGCSLRTGALILLWFTLIVRCIYTLVLVYIATAIHDEGWRIFVERDDEKQKFYLRVYFYRELIENTVAIIISVLAIVGIQKNVARYLTPYLYYMGYSVLVYVLASILAVISPSWYNLLYGLKITKSKNEGVMISVVIPYYFFAIALMVYFWVVIKSCRDSMLETPPPYSSEGVTNSSASYAYKA